jgi:hypothetical protein
VSALAAALLAVGAAQAEDPAGSPAPPPATPGEAPVELDKLLRLPSSLDYSAETRRGDSRGEWRARFRRVREALDAERVALREAEAKLEDVAHGKDAWQVAPPLPGAANPPEAPLDFQLRQELRRHREEVERLEGRLRELEIEANLAGVPEDWRE